MQAKIYKEVPFDPSQLKVEVKNTTIGKLCEMLEHDMFDLQPNFQRHPNIWNNSKKSRFIESIILGLPIPSLYFYVDHSSKRWIVIDGLQRLCALKDFVVDQSMHLRNLEFLDKYSDYSYDDFTYFERVEMSMRDVTLNIISGEASKEAIYLIFKRINSDGVVLKPAEIRNALYCGKGMDFVKSVADSEEFLRVIGTSVSINRMSHYDYVSRFMAFYMNGYESYKENMDVFLGEALKYLNDSDGEQFGELRDAFFRSLHICCSLLGRNVFRSPIVPENRKTNPMSITLFETMMYSVSYLNLADAQRLQNRKEMYVEQYAEMFKDPQLQKLLAQGTGKPNSVYYRFKMMEQLVKNVLL